MHTFTRFCRHYRVELAALLVVTIWGVSAPFRKAVLAPLHAPLPGTGQALREGLW